MQTMAFTNHCLADSGLARWTFILCDAQSRILWKTQRFELVTLHLLEMCQPRTILQTRGVIFEGRLAQKFHFHIFSTKCVFERLWMSEIDPLVHLRPPSKHWCAKKQAKNPCLTLQTACLMFIFSHQDQSSHKLASYVIVGFEICPACPYPTFPGKHCNPLFQSLKQ